MYLPVFSRVVPLALRQSYDCPSDWEITLEDTIDSLYITIVCTTILKSIWKEEIQICVHTMSSEKTPHTSPSQVSYGVCILNSLEKRYHEISRLHCMCWLVQTTTTNHNQAWIICLILGIYCMCKPCDPEQLQADTVCGSNPVLWHGDNDIMALALISSLGLSNQR